MKTKLKNVSTFAELEDGLRNNNLLAQQLGAEPTAPVDAPMAQHVFAPSFIPDLEEKSRGRVPSLSIVNMLTHAGKFLAVAKSVGAGYSTNVPMYELPNLQRMQATGYSLVNGVDKAETVYKYAVAFRKDAFSDLERLCTLIIAALVLSGAPATTINQVRTIIRKLRGNRKVAKNMNDPMANYISVSQLNYDDLVANFERLIMMASADPNYDPPVEALKILSLETKLETLTTANADVIDALAQLDLARTERNVFFNAEGTGLVEVFINAKKVILTNYGMKSGQYKKVKGLGFKKIVVK